MAAIAETLRSFGPSPADCVRLLSSVDETLASRQPIVAMRKEFGCEGDLFERALLSIAIRENRPRIRELRVYEPVKRLLERELEIYTAPRRPPYPSLEAGSYPFVVAAKFATLRRFPAGALDWEISGFRRSWLFKVPWAELPATLSSVAFGLRGFKPAFFMHVPLRPRSRALILEREVRLAYYRIARSLALQPEMKGLLAEAWFHDPLALRDNPHLAPLNEPYTKHGGFITTVGPAPPDSGITEGNLQRKIQYQNGELPNRLGLAIWPRRAALHWARARPELDETAPEPLACI